MELKRRELARKDRREDLREDPEKYRDEHRAYRVHQNNFMVRVSLGVMGSLFGISVIAAIDFLRSYHLLKPSYILVAIAGFACSAVVEVARRGYFSKVLERLVPRDLPVSHEMARLAQIFFLFVPKRNREHIIGDLEEEYRTSYKRFPRLWYGGQVITLVFGYLWASLRRLASFNSILKMIRK